MPTKLRPAKPTNSSYAKRTELDWFEIQKYESLLGGQKPADDTKEYLASCLSQWAHLVWDRVSLQALLKSDPTRALNLFEKIQANPLAPLGFEINPNAASVVALTAKRLGMLSASVDQFHANEGAIVDLELRTNGVFGFWPWAHISINTSATDRQIEIEFKKWLAFWRKESQDGPVRGDYRQKIYLWNERGLLPHYDLNFFMRISGRRIRQVERLEMSCPDIGEDYRVTHDKALNANARTVFSFATAHALRHLAIAACHQIE